MYALLALVLHALISNAAALFIASRVTEPIMTGSWFYSLCTASAAFSTIGLAATARYLSRRLRRISGVMIGVLCGTLCSAIVGLILRGVDYSLVLYLAILAPTLLAVLLASLLDRPKSGWQT